MGSDEPLFQVLLQGRQLGPYDRRTIVGMRIRHTLASDDVLVDAQGDRLTVADLIGRRPARPFAPQRTGSFSVVQATYAASVLQVRGRGHAIPAFRGEVEARVQTDVLRIAGRRRHGLRWRDDRIKLPLADIVHAQATGSEVDLGLRSAGRAPQRLRLELFTADAARSLLEDLPQATPWPAPAGTMPAAPAAATMRLAGGPQVLWVVLGSATFVLGVMLAVLLARRLY